MTEEQFKSLTPPFYLIDLAKLEDKYYLLKKAFEHYFHTLDIAYSYKTNYTPAMLTALHQWGALAEVVSIHEWNLARKLNIPGNKIVFNGPNKYYSHIESALNENSLLNLDSFEEITHVCNYAKKNGKCLEVGLRINGSIKNKNNPIISRFGINSGQLQEAKKQLENAGVRLVGIHIHLSSRKRNLSHYAHLARCLGESAIQLGLDNIRYIDMGGGFGYLPKGMDALDIPSFDQYAQIIHQTLEKISTELPKKRVVIEPGLALVGSVYSYFAPVTALKKTNGKTQVFVDGSVHTVKPSSHSFNLPTIVYDKRWQRKTGNDTAYDIVGYTCMETDFIARDQKLPPLEPGDILKIDNVGAYTLVFNPPFIRPRPAIYLQNNQGRIIKICREETIEDWLTGYVTNG